MSTPSEPVKQSPAEERAAQRPAGGPHPGQPAAPPAEHGPGVVRRTTDGVKRAALVLIGAVFALFAVQNRDNVQVRWIFGDPIDTPLILALLVVFAAGAAIGWLVAKLGTRKSRQAKR